jgi:hypothetical protein
MKDLFVPYEQSLQLKELGFDEPCLAFYNTKVDESLSFVDLFGFVDEKIIDDYYYNSLGLYVSAPTFSQAFKFIREKYNLIGLVEGGYDNGKNIFTYVIWEGFKDIITDDYFETPEEVELECLNELIKMLKENGK